MAIKDISRKPYLQDEEDQIHIGIDLPFRRGTGSEGWFATTKITSEAIKNDIRNFFNTKQGERFFQPSIGTGIHKYLFEQGTTGVEDDIETDIRNLMGFWFPYVVINSIDTRFTLHGSEGRHKIQVSMIFTIQQDPGKLESLQLEFGE